MSFYPCTGFIPVMIATKVMSQLMGENVGSVVTCRPVFTHPYPPIRARCSYVSISSSPRLQFVIYPFRHILCRHQKHNIGSFIKAFSLHVLVEFIQRFFE
uniref:Uncharacterized protein n=1 Tax=Ixodes ricinus TaxID=34613 RepID=A0A6B0UBJ4_IXORI